MIKKSIIKIASILLIIGLNWTGISAVIQTVAYYLNNEDSGNNVFTATTLDFSLSSPGDFSPVVTPSNPTANRSVSIANDGALDFEYNIKTNNVAGDLCDYLNLSADLGGDNKYAGVINDLDYNAGQFGTVGGDWQFAATLTSSDNSLQGKTCNFDFVFYGTQIGGAGFYDEEIISNTVTAGTWQTCWVQTTYDDFNAGQKNDVDIATSPGDVILTTISGSEQQDQSNTFSGGNYFLVQGTNWGLRHLLLEKQDS